MRRPSPADQLAYALRVHLEGQPSDRAAALDAYHRRTGYRDRLRQRMRRAGIGRQTLIGWTVDEMAKRAGVERAAALRMVRGLVSAGRVVRIGRGRFLDAAQAPAIRLRRTTIRLGSHVERLESA